MPLDRLYISLSRSERRQVEAKARAHGISFSRAARSIITGIMPPIKRSDIDIEKLNRPVEILRPDHPGTDDPMAE